MDGVIVAIVCILSTLSALQTMNALRRDRLATGKHTTMSGWRHVRHDVCSLQELCDKPAIAPMRMLCCSPMAVSIHVFAISTGSNKSPIHAIPTHDGALGDARSVGQRNPSAWSTSDAGACAEERSTSDMCCCSSSAVFWWHGSCVVGGGRQRECPQTLGNAENLDCKNQTFEIDGESTLYARLNHLLYGTLQP